MRLTNQPTMSKNSTLTRQMRRTPKKSEKHLMGQKAEKVERLATAKGKSSGGVKLPEISANARIQYAPAVAEQPGFATEDALRTKTLGAFPYDGCHSVYFEVEGALKWNHQTASVAFERGYEALCDALIDANLARITFSRLRVELSRVELDIIVVGGVGESAIREEVLTWLVHWLKVAFEYATKFDMGVAGIPREHAQLEIARIAYDHERDRLAVAENFKRLNPGL